MSAATVFLSWQSDTPTVSGRNFVERALTSAVKRISNDLEFDDRPEQGLVVDKDTKGTPGSPHIFDTIRRKIESAAVFVPDLTFVSRRSNGDPSPNPNVLIEYGYALKALGSERIVAVMNSAYGEPSRETLPFDLADYRYPITYNVQENGSESLRKTERDRLTATLERAIRDVLCSTAYLASLPKESAPIYRAPLGGKARFRAKGERLGFIRDMRRAITGGADHPCFLADGPAMWLRVGPVTPPTTLLPLGSLEQRITPLVTLPFCEGGSNSYCIRSADGYGFCARLGEEEPCYSVVFVFTDAEIWSVETLQLRLQNCLSLNEAKLSGSLEQCATWIGQSLDITGPYRFVIGLEGVSGRPIVHPGDRLGRQRGACATDAVEYEGTFDPATQTSNEVLEPFYLKLFGTCGVKR